MNMKKVLCFDKSFEVFNNILDGDCVVNIYRKTNVTIAYIHRFMECFQNAGLIKKVIKEKQLKREFYLTEKGKELQKRIGEFEKSLEG